MAGIAHDAATAPTGTARAAAAAGHAVGELGLDPEQMTQVEPTLDVPAVLEKIRRTYVAKARREAEGDVECARKIPA